MADELDLSPMPEYLIFTGEDQSLRRKRVVRGKHRTWQILPRYGTAASDRWTVVGTPHPAPGNPAEEIENGQFPSLEAARHALTECMRIDDGTHEEDL